MADGKTGNASQQTVGYLLAIAQAILYATMGICAKAMQNTGMNSEQVMLLRFFFTVVLLGAFLLITGKQRLFSRKPLTYVAAFLFFFSAYLYFLAVDRLTAGLATVLYFTYPAFIAFLSLFVFRDRLTLQLIIVLVLNLGGVFLISEVYLPGQAVMDPIGIALDMAACLAYALYTIVLQIMGEREQKKASAKGTQTPDTADAAGDAEADAAVRIAEASEKDIPEGPFTTTFCVSVVCLAISLIVFRGQIPTLFELRLGQIGMGVYMAVFNTIVPLVLYAMAVARVGATRTSLVGVSETPISLLLSFLILGETIRLGQGIGALCILIAVLVITARKKAA